MQQYPHSPSNYQQPQLVDSYWMQEPAHAQSYPTEASNNLNQHYDFTNIQADLFQPEEIFQLDQPIKPDFVSGSQNDLARSPSTLLDLGSGTIHREFKSEEYWSPNNLSSVLNDDSNNSSSSRFNLSQSPDHTALGLNNNIHPVLEQNMYMETTKIDEMAFQLQKVQNCYQQNMIETDYKPYQNYETLDNKIFYPEEPNIQSFDAYQSKSMKPNYHDKYIDISQYSEYNNFLNAYDNTKIASSNDNVVFNEIDFRINLPNVNNVHSDHDNYDVHP